MLRFFEHENRWHLYVNQTPTDRESGGTPDERLKTMVERTIGSVRKSDGRWTPALMISH